jgi:glycosyltransferase involved in cell wall biosynthesis
VRILTVVTDLDKGGVQRTAQHFAVAYKRMGHDSRVLAFNGLGPRAMALRDADVPVHLGDSGFSPLSAWGPDLIHLHAHQLGRGEVARVLAIAPEARVMEKNVFARRSPWTADVDVSLQLSAWCDWIYHARAGMRAAPTAIVANPAATTIFAPQPAERIAAFRARLGIPPSARLIGRVGQAYRTKWSSVLARAFVELRQREPELWLLAVNPPRELLGSWLPPSVRDAVVVVDRIDNDEELAVAYSSMEVFAHAASQGESFGNVLVESMMCGTPVVTLSTPWGDNSQTEVVGHLDAGLVTSRPASFTAAVALLLEDAELRRRLAAQGRVRALRRFSDDHVAAQALEAITEQGIRGTLSASTRRAIVSQQLLDTMDPPSALVRWLAVRPRLRVMTRFLTGHDRLRSSPLLTARWVSRHMRERRRQIRAAFRETRKGRT